MKLLLASPLQSTGFVINSKLERQMILILISLILDMLALYLVIFVFQNHINHRTLTENKIKALANYYKEIKRLPVDWKYEPKKIRLYLE